MDADTIIKAFRKAQYDFAWSSHPKGDEVLMMHPSIWLEIRVKFGEYPNCAGIEDRMFCGMKVITSEHVPKLVQVPVMPNDRFTTYEKSDLRWLAFFGLLKYEETPGFYIVPNPKPVFEYQRPLWKEPSDFWQPIKFYWRY